MDIQVTVSGLDELAARIKESPALVVGELSKAINGTIFAIQNKAMRESPVKTGALRGSISRGARMTGTLEGKVTADVPYAIFVHEGTKPHIIQSHGDYPLRNRKTGQVFGRLVHHPGTRANPFFVRGIEAAAPTIERLFQNAIDNVAKGLA